jgi:hypothetical protein
LEIDVATWKDRTTNCQEKLTLLTKDLEIAHRGNIRADKLYSAFIRMRYLYKDAIHMTTRDLEYDMGEGQVKEESQEHFQQMDPHDLYMEADRLSKEAGVPDDL